jgi:formylglycine-generating enzyme required for sulfatase activity/KaiC/GvpD/RAD55 family RecA-like ATPase
MSRTRVFVLCAPADASYLDELRTHVAGAGDVVELWHEEDMLAGAHRQQEIESVRESAPLALLFVSPDLLASNGVTARDLPAVVRRLDAGQVKVLCLHARPSLLGQDVPLGPLQDRLTELRPLNEPTRPLSALEKTQREARLAEIAATILRLARDGVSGDADRREYLERLRDSTRRLELRGLRAERAEQLELEQVYTRLRVAGPAAGERSLKAASKEALEQGHDRELRELLGEHACLALVGAPGSGKSTFLQFVALNLARAGLGEDRDTCMARLGLRGDPPLPILVRLADFARFLEAPGAAVLPSDCAELFYRFLEQPARGLPSHLPASFRRRRLGAGGCLLLLDGLDEVPGDDTRARVSTIIDEVVADGVRVGNRHVVTCRTRAYEGRTRLGAEFTRALLVDFGEEEVAVFVRQWSRALFAGQPVDAADAHEDDLLTAIRAHPHVQPLTRNPLLLTILAVVHWDRKKLPEQRADLYDAAVESLLVSRPDDERDVTERRHALQALALSFFTDPAGVRKTLDRHEAVATLAQVLDMEEREADRFLTLEELRSGLLISRREGEVEFSHLTFGEYLAALELAWQARGGWDILRPRVFDPAWSEVVLLLAGCLWKRGRGLVPELIDNILTLGDGLADRARQVGLIGRILRDVRVRAEGRDPAAKTGYAAALREVLAAFEPGSTVPESVRVEVGEALGQAGDPRIHEDDHEDRVFIEGGTFLMGSEDMTDDFFKDERPVHRVTVSGFWIDRYPVTVARYARFVEVYKERAPGGWEEQQRHPNWPVMRVTWHQAQAYCAWLSERSGHRVVLPTEAQWEYAARGRAGRKYPWSDAEPTDRHMNFDNHVGRPTPVGIYPLGATPEGVQDLSGNVWEWCADWYRPYQPADAIDPAGPSKGTSRVLRGGGFHHYARRCRAACRRSARPEGGDGDVGFRGVVVFREDIND